MTVNLKQVLSRHSGLKDLNSLMGKYLYMAVLVQEETGTDSHLNLHLTLTSWSLRHILRFSFNHLLSLCQPNKLTD